MIATPRSICSKKTDLTHFTVLPNFVAFVAVELTFLVFKFVATVTLSLTEIGGMKSLKYFTVLLAMLSLVVIVQLLFSSQHHRNVV